MKKGASSLFCFFLLLASCSSSKAPKRFEGVVMTIPYSVQVGHCCRCDEQQVEAIIEQTFSEIDALYNNWNPHSEITKINQLAAFEKITLSDELAEFLTRVSHWVEFTEGRFDPTVEPLQLLWKTHLKEGHLPDEEDIRTLACSVGWDKIHLEGNFFWKEDALTSLDLSGVAKGHGVDLLTERLIEAGFKSLCVEWGGEVRAHGKHPSDRAWKIGIVGAQPLELREQAIATSGTYLQNWSLNETVYSHIINPHTKLPLQNALISSASVIAPSCAEADALATACMLLPTKELAEAWAEKKKITLIIW